MGRGARITATLGLAGAWPWRGRQDESAKGFLLAQKGVEEERGFD
jgi:hypothetical protein